MSYICSRRCSTRGRPNTDRTKVWFALPCWQSRSRIYLSAGCMARRMRFQGTRSRIHLGRERQKRPGKSGCSGVIQVSDIHLLAMQDRLLLWVDKNIIGDCIKRKWGTSAWAYIKWCNSPRGVLTRQLKLYTEPPIIVRIFWSKRSNCNPTLAFC